MTSEEFDPLEFSPKEPIRFLKVRAPRMFHVADKSVIEELMILPCGCCNILGEPKEHPIYKGLDYGTLENRVKDRLDND